MLDVKVEYPFEQSSPAAHARRFFLRRGLSGWGFAGEALADEWEPFDYATWRWALKGGVEANQMQTRVRFQGGQPLHEFQRRHDDMGGAVFDNLAL